MKILLHICCGPCALMPLQRLLEEGHSVTGYFYNPNIHPLQEYLRRRESAAEAARRLGVGMIWAAGPEEPEEYDTGAWIAEVGALEAQAGEERCNRCLMLRLRHVFAEARARAFDAFSSSLLYSRYQRHEFIARSGNALAQEGANLKSSAPSFYYRDFRLDWQQGIELSKALGLYRQPYCGCIFSENERYAGALHRSSRALSALPALPTLSGSGQ